MTRSPPMMIAALMDASGFATLSSYFPDRTVVTYDPRGLGQEATVFPSHHGGFLGGEFGQAGEPEAFAVRVRQVLDSA